MSAPLSAQSQPPRRVVAIDCAAAEAALPGTCAALKDALRGAVPGAVQRIVTDAADAPARPGDVALALRVDGDRMGLDWRVGGDALAPGPRSPIPEGPDAAARLVASLLAGLPPDRF